MNPNVGIVAIGRNEGERLQACLRAAAAETDRIVYVDSGSTDGSVEFAQSLGVDVVNLDTTIPFTAARGRNAGFDRLISQFPGVVYAQFVDGDCELQSGWVPRAAAFLAADRGVAAVCGQRFERYPEKSVYNQLCDWEWRKPEGPAKYCGGDVMIRVKALVQVDRYRESLIAGEEPELCVRLRQAGWSIHVLDAPMTQHDANMHKFGQWWQRTKRSGYAYAAGARLHGATPERLWVWETIRCWVWGVGPPASVVLAAWWLGWPALLILLVYPLQVARLCTAEAGPFRDRAVKALFNTLSRFPELFGQLRFAADALTGRNRLIEYK